MQSEIIWCCSDDEQAKILIEPPILNLIRSYSQHQIESPESGGLLLGYRRDKHVHIVLATTPQPDDKRNRYRFLRCSSSHQRFALQQWKQSDNKIDYVGEWHTHPESDPSPSSLDTSEWRKICGRREQRMVFLIVGWSGSFWLGVSQGQNIVQASRMNIEWNSNIP